MKYRYLLACVILVLAGINAHGQDRLGLSLPQLWEEAFANYPGLEAYRSQHRQANINRRLTGNRYLPDVHLQAQSSLGTQNAVSGSFFPLPGLYNVNGSELGNASSRGTNLYGSVMVDWKFLQFGKQRKLQQAANISARQATRRVEIEQLRLQAGVTRTYFQLFYHRGMEEWAQKNIERIHAILRASASRVQSGLSPAADSLLIKAALKQTSADVHLWQGRRAESRMELARWLHMPVSELNLNEASFLRADTRLELLVSEQNSNPHPVLAYRGEQIAYAEKQEELASANALPSVSLLGGAQLRGNSMNADDSFSESWQHSYNSPVHNYAIGLGLTWDVGNAFDSRLEKRRYQEELRQREAESEEAALNLRSREEIAQQQIIQSMDQIADAAQAYESANQAYALFDARYNSGLISITDLLQIQDVLQNAEKILIEAYYRHWLFQVDLAESAADFSHLQSVFE